MKIGHPKDFWGGVMFAVIGGLFALIAYGMKFGGTVLIPGYAMGVPARMGPAFFPFWLGVILFGLGVVIAITGFRHTGPADSFPTFHWKPNLFVLGGVVIFGIILKWTGMLIAGIVLVVIACMGSHDFRVKRVAACDCSVLRQEPASQDTGERHHQQDSGDRVVKCERCGKASGRERQ